MHGSQLTTVSAIPRTWVGTGHLLSMDVTPPGITTHDSLCSPPCLGRHWTFTLYARYTTRDHNSRQSLLSPGSQVTTVSALPPVWAGTRNVLSMHVIQPGITTHDSLCSHPCLGRHWTFTLYGRYTTRDHNSRQSLLSPPAWVGTGNLLSMHVTPPEITAPDSLCPPPCLGRHWKFTLYARYTTRDHSSRQSLPSPVPG
ncbi:hypothetical protein J6590_074393 [Homalodisca vitripennis]|nr:hypothetical protein J6590_074393 [Homalodisca vitripennis]